jgi:hypothetical protein
MSCESEPGSVPTPRRAASGARAAIFAAGRSARPPHGWRRAGGRVNGVGHGSLGAPGGRRPGAAGHDQAGAPA